MAYLFLKKNLIMQSFSKYENFAGDVEVTKKMFIYNLFNFHTGHQDFYWISIAAFSREPRKLIVLDRKTLFALFIFSFFYIDSLFLFNFISLDNKLSLFLYMFFINLYILYLFLIYYMLYYI